MGEIIPFIDRTTELLNVQIVNYLHLIQRPALSSLSNLIPFPNNNTLPYVVTHGGWRTFAYIPYQPHYPYNIDISTLTLSPDNQPYVFFCLQRDLTAPHITTIGLSYKLPHKPHDFLQFYTTLNNQETNTDLFVYPAITRNPHPFAPHPGFAPIPTSIYLFYKHLRNKYHNPHLPWNYQSETQFWRWLTQATYRHFNFLHAIHPALFPFTPQQEPAQIIPFKS